MAEQFNDSNLPGVRAAMHNALKDVGRKFGVRVETSSASYAPYGLTFKVKLFVLDEKEQERPQVADPKWPKPKKGDKIEVYDYRGGKTSTVIVIDDPLYQDDEWEVAIQYDNGDKHYGVWDEKEQRWESGAGFYVPN